MGLLVFMLARYFLCTLATLVQRTHTHTNENIHLWHIKQIFAINNWCITKLDIPILQFLREIRKRKANWIGHILRRNCLLQQVIEGKIKRQIEVTRRRGRRRKKLLDDLQDRRGYSQLKEEALYRTMLRNRFGRGFGPVVWQITDDDDDITV